MPIVLTSQRAYMQPLFRFILTKGWIELVGKQPRIVFPLSHNIFWASVENPAWQSVGKCQLPQDPDSLDTLSEHYPNRAAIKPLIQLIFIYEGLFTNKASPKVCPRGRVECLTDYSAQHHKLWGCFPPFPSSVFSWCNYTFAWLQSVTYHEILGWPQQLECRSWKHTDHLL